jgi:hypothetical protein
LANWPTRLSMVIRAPRITQRHRYRVSTGMSAEASRRCEQQDAADKRRAIGTLRAPSLSRRLQLNPVLDRPTETDAADGG